MKISEWLSELDSHGIYDNAACRADFQAKTAKQPSWPGHTMTRTLAYIKHRGIGGHVDGHPDQRMSYGWEIAEGLADKYAPGPRMSFEGRGRRFREAISVLIKAGL
jgi:hypothetical protein